MTITNGYGDLNTFIDRAVMTDAPPTDSARDAVIEAIIQAVSRQIDSYCFRRFFVNSADEVRYFTPENYSLVFTDDIQSITTLKTDEDADGTYEVTWAATDYRTFPFNRVVNYSPITYIKLKPNGNYVFPMVEQSTEITGKFGYCTLANVPDQIKEACYIQANRIYARQKSPFGIVGSAELGTLQAISKLDADVMEMIRPFRKLVV